MVSTTEWIQLVYANAKCQAALKNNNAAMMFCALFINSPPVDPDPWWNKTTQGAYFMDCELTVKPPRHDIGVTLPF